MSTTETALPPPRELRIFHGFTGDMAVMLDPTGERTGLSVNAAGALALAAAGVGVQIAMDAADWRALARLANAFADELAERETKAEAVTRDALARITQEAAGNA